MHVEMGWQKLLMVQSFGSEVRYEIRKYNESEPGSNASDDAR